MTRTHVPVLAGELIDLTQPGEGDRVVDCTFGAGGHARLMADRIGPGGTLVCVDRDPAAQERFDEMAAEVSCETRFLRMDYADALALLREEGLKPISSTSTSASPRCRSTLASGASPTRSTRRWTCAWIRARTSMRVRW
ncbi:MAG: 16S rRNA (cytosine(1402)-N(4))-methyltransferase [Thermoleophilaceae bacterium]